MKEISNDELIRLLRKTELFALLPDDILTKISKQSTLMTVPAGELIIRKGGEGDNMFLVTRGSVKVHDDLQVVAEFKSGEVVGELALLDKGPRSMNVTTLEECDFLQVNREAFFRLLKDRPDIVEKIIGILTQRLRNQNLRLVESLIRREEELTGLVEERTRDLNIRNRELRETLDQLQSAQQQLVMAEKMASLVQLTAGIAHEIQNPLNFIINFSALAQDLLTEIRSTTDKSEQKKLMEDLSMNLAKILQHGHRADATIKSMLLHSRTGSSEKQLSDVSDMIAEIMRLTYHGFRNSQPAFHCRLDFRKDDSLPRVPLMQQDFNRVLINLFNNAFYSMNLRRTSSDKDGIFDYEPVLTIHTGLRNGMIDIHIRDNGEGIPVDIREKIFNPFFTTKPTGVGTGLGLSLSYDIVTKGHGGRLTMHSETGEFTEFVISIPLG
jgi:signal transduction histidine kinase